MENYSEDQINKMIISYKKRQARDKAKYDKNKDNEEFKAKNRARAKSHYQANKELKLKKYQDNKDLLKSRSLYNYYKYHNRINEFIDKYPDKVELMNNHGFTISNSGSGSD